MSTTQMVDSIYISIASFMDKELKPTIESFLKNTKNLNNVFVYILCQDEDYPDLDTIFKEHNFESFYYDKRKISDLGGVGHARSICQSKLTSQYKFFFQIDSHTQFKKDWDELIIKDYIDVHKEHGKSIISTYPTGYEYTDKNEIIYIDQASPPIVKIINSESNVLFEAKYTEHHANKVNTGYFCGGQVFGFSEYFLEVPYDKKIAFNGEEQTLSVRFFKNGTAIICPPNTYIYHDYVGDRRQRNWNVNPRWQEIIQESDDRLQDFYSFKIKDKFGVDQQTLEKWKKCFVQD